MHRFEIKEDRERELVLVTASGEFDIQTTSEMITAARALSTELRWPLLYDLRDVTTSVCESELYELIHSHPSLKADSARKYSSALVLGPAIPSKLSNFGINEAEHEHLPVRVFHELGPAIQWLDRQIHPAVPNRTIRNYNGF